MLLSISFTTISFPVPKYHNNIYKQQSIRFKAHAFLNKPLDSPPSNQPSILIDSLRVLEWDKLCDSVASFAGTSLGKISLKEQLGFLNQTFEDSLKLLEETNAAVEMHKYGAMLDFHGIDMELVKTAIQVAHRGFPVSGTEAIAVVALLQFAEALQSNVKAAIKQDAEWYQRFMPLTEMIMELTISRSLVKFIQQLVDEDGTVKDSASSALKQSRDQVRLLERKLYQLMESLIRNGTGEASSLEVNEIDGRWCIRSGFDQRMSFEGLLLSRNSTVYALVVLLLHYTAVNYLRKWKQTLLERKRNTSISKPSDMALLSDQFKTRRGKKNSSNSLNCLIAYKSWINPFCKLKRIYWKALGSGIQAAV